ncbi:hypothetical protein ABFY57_00860 [Paenibacillus polymyxa]|uniref:hypothetical protein n=1 Tax=Paenibacillus polymyxa TaxID=1406 RepID=UPI00211D5F46|nr:hypothetical protein [Paenibacillus polymyxa]
MDNKTEGISFNGSLMLNLDVRYENGKMSLLAVKDFKFSLDEENDPRVIYSNANPTQSWTDYNLMKISGKSEISKILKPHDTITLCYENVTYMAKMHSSIPGRIDGLAGLYRDNPELAKAKTIHFFFNSSNNKIVIKKELEYEDAIQILKTRGEVEAASLLESYVVAKENNTSGWDGHLSEYFPQLARELKLY